MSSRVRPLVTVAVPSLDQCRFLETALESILGEPVPVEIMVADGGSTDRSPEIIRSYGSRLAWARTAADRGQSSAINEAIAQGSAPLVCWLNADDYYLPGGLAALVHALVSDSGADVVYGDCLLVGERGEVQGRHASGPFSTRSLARGSCIPQPASLIRRAVWEQVGGLDETLKLALDYDLWWRLHRAGARFRHVPLLVAAARLHGEAKTVRHARQQYDEAAAVAEYHFGSLPWIWRFKRPLSVRAREGRGVAYWLATSWRRLRTPAQFLRARFHVLRSGRLAGGAGASRTRVGQDLDPQATDE